MMVYSILYQIWAKVGFTQILPYVTKSFFVYLIDKRGMCTDKLDLQILLVAQKSTSK